MALAQDNPKDEAAVTRFYVETDLYLYELLGSEIDASEHRMGQDAELADFLLAQGKKRGLDYGSGIGTLGIYLNQSGDSSRDFATSPTRTSPSFARAPARPRNLQAPRCFSLLKEKLQAGATSFITAFDVLEHVTLRSPIRRSAQLRPGGLFIFNLLADEEEDSLHILKDLNRSERRSATGPAERSASWGSSRSIKKVDLTTAGQLSASDPRLSSVLGSFVKACGSASEKADTLGRNHYHGSHHHHHH